MEDVLTIAYEGEYQKDISVLMVHLEQVGRK